MNDIILNLSASNLYELNKLVNKLIKKFRIQNYLIYFIINELIK